MIFNLPPTKHEVWVGVDDHDPPQVPTKKTKKSSIWRDIRWVSWLLRMTGIHLGPSPLLAFVGSLAFLLGLAYVASEVAFCGLTGFVGSSVVLCMGSTLLLTLLLWITMMRRRKGIAKLVEECGTLYQGSNNGLNRATCLGALYSLLAPPLASLGGILFSEDDSYYLHCYLFGDSAATSPDFPLLLFFLTLENYLQLFLPNLASLLAVFLCERLAQAVAEERWGQMRGEGIEIYGKTRRIFEMLCEVFSLPIFLIISQKFLTLFFTLTVILSSKRKQVLIQLIEGCFLAFNAALTLLAIILSGSRLQESHRKVRSSLLLGGGQELLRAFVEREDMVVVAAGMIPLTRSLFLKIGAALVTYGVLIVQLDN